MYYISQSFFQLIRFAFSYFILYFVSFISFFFTVCWVLLTYFFFGHSFMYFLLYFFIFCLLLFLSPCFLIILLLTFNFFKLVVNLLYLQQKKNVLFAFSWSISHWCVFKPKVCSSILQTCVKSFMFNTSCTLYYWYTKVRSLSFCLIQQMYRITEEVIHGVKLLRAINYVVSCKKNFKSVNSCFHLKFCWFIMYWNFTKTLN